MRKKLPIVLAATALIVAVLAWQTPAIAHGVQRRDLCAQRPQGRRQTRERRSCARAHTAFDGTTAVGGASVELTSTTINVPKKGFLIVTASTVFNGSGGELIHCGVELGDVPGWVSSDGPGQSVGLVAGDDPAPCAATFRFRWRRGSARSPSTPTTTGSDPCRPGADP